MEIAINENYGTLVLNAVFSFIPGLGNIAASAIAGGRLLCADFSFRYRLFKDIDQYIFCRG